MKLDPIVAEIHAAREELSKVSGDDIRAIADAARTRQMLSGRPTVRLPPREVKETQQAS